MSGIREVQIEFIKKLNDILDSEKGEGDVDVDISGVNISNDVVVESEEEIKEDN